MNRIVKLGPFSRAAIVFAGAAAIASAAQATNWDALSTADWRDTSAGPAVAGEQLAAAGAGADWGAEISAGFQQLGMAEARARCYGEVLARELGPEDQQEAARIVRESPDGDSVKFGVLTGGPDLIGGFSAADVSCPESMGS